MQRALVTGGAGFIGSHLVDRLLDRGHDVVVIDNFEPNYPAAIKRGNLEDSRDRPGFRLVEADLRDAEAVRRLVLDVAPDIVFHLAAQAGVRRSIQRPAEYLQSNVATTIHLLEAVRPLVPKVRVVYASSSSVYGDRSEGPFRESDAADTPISPYAATKRACELIAHTYHSLYGTPVTGLRLFTAFGPRNRPDLAMYRFAQRIASGTPIQVYGDGTTYRDYTYVSDIVDGFLQAAEHCEQYHIYNLGSTRPIELGRMIEELADAMGCRPVLEHVEEQPGDVRGTWADTSRARLELGYEPATPFADGIAEFVRWFHAAQARWASTLEPA